MAKKPSKYISVKQGLDERFLRGILTRDISPLEAVFDLIDNSIDAARNDLLSRGATARDKFELPESYKRYRISLRITDRSFVISDNCYGMERAALQNETFIIGKPSSHPQGIGYFGVGLKRALLALGAKFAVRTNRPEFAADLRLTAADMSLRNKPLKAEIRQAKPWTRTTIAISKLQPGAAHDFSGARDFVNIQDALARRYGLFIRKGLQIWLNGQATPSFAPTVRKRGPIRPKKWHDTVGKVKVFVEAGMHARYRVTTEKDHDREVNSGLTDQYGWYIVCNDRTIEVASKDKRLGFSTYWHPEYNGFLGWVHFVADDPADLPWDTKKTEIDVRSDVFQSIVGNLREFSDEFRKENRAARKRPGKAIKGTKRKTGKPTPTQKAPKNHVNDWDTLLPSLSFAWSDAKLSSLLSEAEDLQVDYSYSGCALLRMIVERALDQHVRRSKRLTDVKNSVAQEQKASGRSFTPAQLATFEPTLSQLLDWVKKTPDYFPAEVRSECSHAASKFALALSKTLNGAMHKSTIVDSTQLVAIRNEVYPLIEFLVTSKPQP